MFGDPQPRNQKEVDCIAHDFVEELVGTDASFGVTLGDIVFDGLDLFESQAATIGLIGIPWYNVIGNHDINYDAKNDRTSDETFERNFGPPTTRSTTGPCTSLCWTMLSGWSPREVTRAATEVVSVHGKCGSSKTIWR